jgi:hypothetical protein
MASQVYHGPAVNTRDANSGTSNESIQAQQTLDETVQAQQTPVQAQQTQAQQSQPGQFHQDPNIRYHGPAVNTRDANSENFSPFFPKQLTNSILICRQGNARRVHPGSAVSARAVSPGSQPSNSWPNLSQSTFVHGVHPGSAVSARTVSPVSLHDQPGLSRFCC